MSQDQSIQPEPQSFISLLLSQFYTWRRSQLGRKLLISVVAISSLFTFVQAALQLYSDYDTGVDRIQQQLNQIELSYTDSLARSIWEVDSEQINNIASGISALPDVGKLIVFEVMDNDSDRETTELTSIGELSSNNFVKRDIPIHTGDKENAKVIGQLTIYISLDPLYNDLYGKFLFILAFQTIKTFSVAIFILAIFNYLVTQHLSTMALFSKQINLDNLDEKLDLKRNTKKADELTQMVHALNDTKDNMKKMLAFSSNSTRLEIELNKKNEQEKMQQAFNQKIQEKNHALADANEEQQALIEQLQETKDNLVRSEKMAALGGMVNGVAHELNTPIGMSITGNSHVLSETKRLIGLLEEGRMSKEELEEYLDTTSKLGQSISVSLEKAAHLIKSFKMVSVEQHDDILSSFNVHQNFADILYSLSHSLKSKNITINNNIPNQLDISSYPGILYQVYTNLINNAVLHAFEGKEAGTIDVSAVANTGGIDITFSDDGLGMSPTTLEKLFDPFFTTKRANGGTGLGMNIVFNLITEKLQGQIEVKSELGQGSQFIFSVVNIKEEEIIKPELLAAATDTAN